MPFILLPVIVAFLSFVSRNALKRLNGQPLARKNALLFVSGEGGFSDSTLQSLLAAVCVNTKAALATVKGD